MSPAARPDLGAFLRRYVQVTAGDEPAAIEQLYTPTFLMLDPASATAVTREALIAALPLRRKVFGSAGIDGLDLVGWNEQPLDEVHTLVHTTWSARFAADAGEQAPLTITADWVLRRTDDSWQIAVYLNHTHLPQVLQCRQRATS